MNFPAMVLAAVTLGLIGVLPRIFFRHGKLNLMWWLTAMPFVIGGASLAATAAGLLPIFPSPNGLAGRILAAAAILPTAAGLGLIGYTLGTHRVPVSLWHQTSQPQHFVNWGAYARVRHPFYAAFLLTLIGSVLAAPSWGTLAALVYGALVLDATAAREEDQLSATDFGEAYRAYMARTGRFLPKFAGDGDGR